MTRSGLGRLGQSVLLTAIVLAASPAGRALAAEDPRDVKIAETLKEMTIVEFIEAPLKDVVDYLNDYHSLMIKFDTKALEAAKINPDAPITIKDDTLTLGKALDKMLGPLKLDYIVKDHVLTITTAAVAKEWKKANENKKP